MASPAARLAAAWLLTSSPAFAQTDDPNPGRADLDCIAGQSGCAPQRGAGVARPVAVPDLIVDLFPATVTASPAQPSDGSLPDNPPLPQPAPRGAQSLAILPPTVSQQAIIGAFVPDEVLVTVDGDDAVVADLAASFGLDIRSQRLSGLLGVTLVRFGIPDDRPVALVLAQLAGDGRIRARTPNHLYELQQAAGAVNYAFRNIGLDSATANGEGVGIAVIDTAIEDTHPALKAALAGQLDAMPDVPVTSRDHATSVAGLIAGSAPSQGMAPGSKIYHARAFESGRSSIDVILAALDWSASQDVRIINMSFVGPANDLLAQACAEARARDFILVAAAGNNGPKAPYGYPAAYKGVIAVTATDDRNELMQQANRGPYVFVSAPGVGMVAPVGGGSDLVTGTSFAAAIVSGAIANLLHAVPDRSADWVERALSSGARDLGTAGRDPDFGFGLLDAVAAAAVK